LFPHKSAHAINNLGALKKRGVLDHPDLKPLVEAKLAAAKTDDRVSAYKAKVAAEAAEVAPDLAKALADVTDARVKAKGRITRPTALLLDKSGSMDVALAVGRQLGALVSAVCEADLFAYAFDTIAYPEDERYVFERARQFVQAEGFLPAPESAYSIACAIDEAMKCKETRERKVIAFNVSGHGFMDMEGYAQVLGL